MSIKEVIQTKENKIIFLKAILLGIKYGRMENSTFYENNISNELNKLQQDKDIIETNYIKNIDDYDSIVNNYSKKITELENFRSNIIKNINNLSYNNYNSNYVKINLLRNNLNNINKELEINRNNILKFIEIKKAKNNKKNTDKISSKERKDNENLKAQPKSLNLEETINRLNTLIN